MEETSPAVRNSVLLLQGLWCAGASILILDDSASALDFATDARLRKAIARRTDQMTVFLVSQRVSAVKNADQILVLDNGRTAGKGTHRELLRNCQIYREICESQMTREEVEADAR